MTSRSESQYEAHDAEDIVKVTLLSAFDVGAVADGAASKETNRFLPRKHPESSKYSNHHHPIARKDGQKEFNSTIPDPHHLSSFASRVKLIGGCYACLSEDRDCDEALPCSWCTINEYSCYYPIPPASEFRKDWTFRCGASSCARLFASEAKAERHFNSCHRHKDGETVGKTKEKEEPTGVGTTEQSSKSTRNQAGKTMQLELQDEVKATFQNSMSQNKKTRVSTIPDQRHELDAEDGRLVGKTQLCTDETNDWEKDIEDEAIVQKPAHSVGTKISNLAQTMPDLESIAKITHNFSEILVLGRSKGSDELKTFSTLSDSTTSPLSLHKNSPHSISDTGDESSFTDETDFGWQKPDTEPEIRTLISYILIRCLIDSQNAVKAVDGSESSSSEQSRGNFSSTTSSDKSPSDSSTRKRKRVGENHRKSSDENDDDNDGKENRPGDIPEFGTYRQSEKSRKFACPYHQRNPELHQKSSCTGPGWDWTRLKSSHLSRVHRRPRHCRRCWTFFNTKRAYLDHDPAKCSIAPEPEDDLLSEIQWDELWGKGNWNLAVSDEDRWKILYQNLFPGEPVPSPYYVSDDDTLETFRDFYRSQMTDLLAKALEQEFKEYLNPIYDELLAKFPMLVNQCSERIFEMCRSRNIQCPRPPAVPLEHKQLISETSGGNFGSYQEQLWDDQAEAQSRLSDAIFQSYFPEPWISRLETETSEAEITRILDC